MASLLADEDFPLRVVKLLRELGHDVATVRERGLDDRQTPDENILQQAATEGRAVLTLNRDDFAKLHNRSNAHAGIVTCTSDHKDPDGLAHRVHDRITAETDLTGKLIKVIRPNRQTGK